MDYLYEAVKDGRIFGVKFIKRTTGEIREMQARLGVKKHLSGGELNYSPVEKNLLIVYDVAKNGYRSIPLENVIEVKIDGQVFRVGKDETGKTDVIKH